MSKSLGNVTAPQDVIKQSGADILRMWVCASDYADDLRIGPEILKTTVETYRKLRNTIRWMLGKLAHFHEDDRVELEQMPELERLMLHRLAELDELVRKAYADFDYKRIFAALSAFMTVDLSAFYFDIRKDALYCDPYSSATRKACLTVLDHLFRCTVTWLAPMLCFTAEEAVAVALRRRREVGASRSRSPRCRPPGATTRSRTNGARCARCAASSPARWRSSARRSASAPRSRRIRSCMCRTTETCSRRWSTSIWPRSASPRRRRWCKDEGPADAFRLPDVAGVAVVPNLAEGTKCARSWKILTTIGADPEYPGRLAARRQGAARMGNHAQGGGVDARSSYLCGPLTRFGLAVAADRLPRSIRPASSICCSWSISPTTRCGSAPFFDFVLTRNTGISYGLFQTQGALGQWVLLGFKALAVRAALALAGARARPADRAVARPDHRRGGGQRHRPAGLRLGRRFRAFPRFQRAIGGSTGMFLT